MGGGSRAVIGAIIVLLIVMAAAWWRSTQPATTPSGGTAPATSPVQQTPTGPTGGTMAGTDVPPLAPALVSMIRILKDSTGKSRPNLAWENQDWKTVNIGEVMAYSDGRLLTGSDYSKAELKPRALGSFAAAANVFKTNQPPIAYASSQGDENVHSLELTLSRPMPIQRVTVYNRWDCCQSRLSGAVLQLLDANGSIIWLAPLNEYRMQDFRCGDGNLCRGGYAASLGDRTV